MLYDSSMMEKWDDFDERVFPDKPILYIPRPTRWIINTAAAFPHYTFEGLSKPEQYDWSSVSVSHYIHVLRFRGFYNNNPSLAKLSGHAYKKAVPNAYDDPAFNIRHSYHSALGDAYLLLRHDYYWERRRRSIKAKEPINYARPLTLKLILKPDEYQDIWTTVRWAKAVAEHVGKYYADGPLRLEYIETPVDMFGAFDRPSVQRCLLRQYGKDMVHVTSGAPGDEGTYYDGRTGKGKKNKVYTKSSEQRGDAMHWEPDWLERGLWDSNITVLNEGTVLLLLIDTYNRNSFRYLDLRRVARTKALRERVRPCWDIFERYGLRHLVNALTKNIRFIHRNSFKNYDRISSVHPIDSCFRMSITDLIAEGVELLRASPDLRCPLRVTRNDVKAKLSDKTFRRELVRHIYRSVGIALPRRTHKKKRRPAS